MSNNLIVHPLKPIINEDSEILFLGSFPSVKSREMNFYYMHKNNRFWNVLSVVYNIDLKSFNNQEKEEFLINHHLAIYDMVESCILEGSLDANMQIMKYSDIDNLIKNTKIKKIILLGKLAYQLFSQNYPHLLHMAYYLPSTSSLNAKYKLDDLVICLNNILKN